MSDSSSADWKFVTGKETAAQLAQIADRLLKEGGFDYNGRPLNEEHTRSIAAIPCPVGGKPGYHIKHGRG